VTGWQQFTDQAPDLAEAVRARFAARKHHVLATVRQNGSPRVNGTGVHRHGSDLVLGSMPESGKVATSGTTPDWRCTRTLVP
jgi:hypothetical protein